MTESHCSIVLIGCSNRLGYRVRPRQLHRIGPTVTRCDGEIILSAIVTKLIFEPKLVFGIFFGVEIGNFRVFLALQQCQVETRQSLPEHKEPDNKGQDLIENC